MTHSALFENYPEPTVAIEIRDGEPVIQAINASFAEVFGFEAAAAVGNSINELIVPDSDLERAGEVDEQAMDGDPVDRELRRETVDGGRDFLLRSIPANDEDDVDFYGVYTDITDRKEREEQLRALFENSSTAIAYVEYADDAPMVQAVNPAFEETFGYDEAAVRGRSIDEFVVPPANAAEAQAINDEARAGHTVETEVERRTADGVRDFFLRSVPVQPDTGGKRTYAIYRDITGRKDRERALQRQNERLDEFASLVSHDLRNPLNVATGHLELAREDADSEHLGQVAAAHDRMATLVEDLLALARQGGRIEEMEPVDLANLCRECWATVVTEDGALAVETDASIQADRSRLRHLLENLFRNAVEHGGTDVTVRVEDLDGGFALADDGRGIPPAARDDVFETGFTTSEEGTGFGLSIVDEIATAHGWEATVTESEAGGARFVVTGVTVADG